MKDLKEIIETLSKHPCLEHPEMCQPQLFKCIFHPELCFFNICKICPVCCFDRPVIEETERFRDAILRNPEILERVGKLLEKEFIEATKEIGNENVVIFVPIVVKRPQTVSELETHVKSGAAILDGKIREGVKKVIL